MRWWGWGDPDHPPGLPAHALAFLRETVGVASQPRPPVALGRVRLAPPQLPAAALEELRALLGSAGVRDGHEERVAHAAGKGYPDLVRLRAGEPLGAPDAVLYPSDPIQLQPLLELCARRSLALVPFGGGTSVVGGVEPLRGEHAAVLALDLRELSALVELDRESLIVTAQAGMRVPALEARLATQGLTLGHFPQSYEHVSLGGCAATRSAGQASTGYGRFEELVLGLRMAAPAGEIAPRALPASAAGPDLRELLVGSEGTLGVIHELALRVRPAPAQRRYEGVFFEDFAAGAQALRALAQERLAPTVARLSDESETRMSLALAGSGGIKGRLGRVYLGARGYGAGCLAILGFEGSEREVATRRGPALELVRRHGGLPVGRSPGEAWRAQRFAAPYLRDESAHARRDGRDARDRDALVAAAGAPPRGEPRDRWRPRGAGDARPRDVPRLPSLRDRCIALLHLPRAPARGAGARSVAGRQAGRERRDPGARRHDHPSPRRWARSRPLDGARDRRAGGAGAARAEGAARPHGHHEPREAAS